MSLFSPLFLSTYHCLSHTHTHTCTHAHTPSFSPQPPTNFPSPLITPGGYEDNDLLDVLQDMYLETKEILQRLLTWRSKRMQTMQSNRKMTMGSSSLSSSAGGALTANLW